MAQGQRRDDQRQLPRMVCLGRRMVQPLEWVDAAMQILGEWTPTREDTAHCLRHDGNCPTFPARTSASTPGRRFHLEISGINCQPWSYAGKRMGWLYDRSIPCLILVQTILSVEPDAVCIECTPAFDFATLHHHCSLF